MGVMHVLGTRGDRETQWDPADSESVLEARKVFERHVKNPVLVFSAPEPGKEGVQTKEFDPDAGEIIVTHPLLGG